MKQIYKNIFKYVLPILGSGLLLWVSFKDIHWLEFWKALKSCNWGYVILAVIAGIFAFIFRGFRWRELVRPISPTTSWLTCFNAINISYIPNMIIPRIGEFIRCVYITRNYKGSIENKPSYEKVLGTAVVDRLWDVMTLILLIIIVMTTMWSKFGIFFRDKLLAPIYDRFSPNPDNFDPSKLTFHIILSLFVICFVIVFVIVKYRKKVKIFNSICSVFVGVFQGIVSCLKIKSWYKCCFYSIMVWVFYGAISMLIIQAVKGIDPSLFPSSLAPAIEKLSHLGLVDGLFLMMVGAISSLVPVPGGFGAFHFLICLALSSVYGIPKEIGIIFATLSHETQIFTQIVCGGLSYFYETFRPKKKD